MVFYTFCNHFKNNFDYIYKNFVCYLTGIYYTYITCPNVIKPYRQNATRHTYDYDNLLNNFNNLEKSNVNYFYDFSNSVVNENNNNHNNDEICYMNVDNNEDINKDYYDHYYYDNNDNNDNNNYNYNYNYNTKDDKNNDNKNNNMYYDNNKNKAD